MPTDAFEPSGNASEWIPVSASTVKQANNVFSILKMVLTWWTFWKGLGLWEPYD